MFTENSLGVDKNGVLIPSATQQYMFCTEYHNCELENTFMKMRWTYMFMINLTIESGAIY